MQQYHVSNPTLPHTPSRARWKTRQTSHLASLRGALQDHWRGVWRSYEDAPIIGDNWLWCVLVDLWETMHIPSAPSSSSAVLHRLRRCSLILKTCSYARSFPWYFRYWTRSCKESGSLSSVPSGGDVFAGYPSLGSRLLHHRLKRVATDRRRLEPGSWSVLMHCSIFFLVLIFRPLSI